MAGAVSSHRNINIKKSLFGLSQKAVFSPTNSPIKVFVLDYTPTEGVRLERLLNLPLDELAKELQTKGKPKSAPIGHYRLECCLSEDHQFCALQLFRFIDFKNQPVFEPRFFEGKEAQIVASLV